MKIHAAFSNSHVACFRHITDNTKLVNMTNFPHVRDDMRCKACDKVFEDRRTERTKSLRLYNKIYSESKIALPKLREARDIVYQIERDLDVMRSYQYVELSIYMTENDIKYASKQREMLTQVLGVAA